MQIFRKISNFLHILYGFEISWGDIYRTQICSFNQRPLHIKLFEESTSISPGKEMKKIYPTNADPSGGLS